MDLQNKTAASITYKGHSYGPGQVIAFDDAHVEGKGVQILLASGGLVPTLGAKAPSEGLTVEQLKEALTAKGIEIPDGAKKAALAGLLDASAA